MAIEASVTELGSPSHPANPSHRDHERWKAKVTEQAKNPDHPACPKNAGHREWKRLVKQSQQAVNNG